ncbi:FUSC family protein [Paraburkholderia sp. UYCP14C]|uniref:FUSC family protein n=1 Tax=Paraburkholderia sp. UYCP14C TaxID=2511130 RepID=UPI00101F4240|nr:FUSC family protein [Paraburkholderia sp. UYCP14C]RZF26748.1 FUSC family protein [Paraburkholderia sp. UYCP14C]
MLPSISRSIASLGFDVPKLCFSLRTAVAACAAFLIAWLLGLDHPQWSAMTIWVAAQPTRGQVLEKSVFRIAGTLTGTLAGILLMLCSGGEPVLLVAGLSVWIALCAGIANAQRGFVAYGTILAGYSASIVALADRAHPHRIMEVGLDRLATILVGVLLALIVGIIFTPHAQEDALTGRLRRLTARVFRDLAAWIGRDCDEPLTEEQRKILAEMAAIEELLEPHGAGSLRSRRMVLAIRELMMTEMSLLLLARRQVTLGHNDLVLPLEDVSACLESGMSYEQTVAAMERLVHAAGFDRHLHELFSVMLHADQAYIASARRQAAGRVPLCSHRVVLHRDWAAAWRAFARAGITMLAVGLIWAATGWSAATLLLLGVSIMVSMVSVFENPAGMMRFIFTGQICGVIAALACQFLAWPLATSELAIVLMTMPVILIAALFYSHRVTMIFGFDYAIVSLLFLHPAFPPKGSFVEMFVDSIFLVAAPLIAMIAYRVVFPLGAANRLRMLVGMMVRELQELVDLRGNTGRRFEWKARLHHRLLRLVSLAGRGGSAQDAAIDGGLTVLAVGSATFTMHELLAKGTLTDGASRSIRAALGRLRRVANEPHKASDALSVASVRLTRLGMQEARDLANAARLLSANAGFLTNTR